MARVISLALCLYSSSAFLAQPPRILPQPPLTAASLQRTRSGNTRALRRVGQRTQRLAATQVLTGPSLGLTSVGSPVVHRYGLATLFFM
jgi:hypothetical protein